MLKTIFLWQWNIGVLVTLLAVILMLCDESFRKDIWDNIKKFSKDPSISPFITACAVILGVLSQTMVIVPQVILFAAGIIFAKIARKGFV